MAPRYILNFLKSFIFNDAHAMTIVTDEVISTTVLKNASGTLSSSDPFGHSVEPTRSRMYDENSAANSITSDPRKSQTPSLPFDSPVSGRTSTVYGISIPSP